jgi:hypothetical protein
LQKDLGYPQLHGTGLRTDECSATRTWLLGQARKGKGAKVHDGQHEAIIDEETWARVQQLLEGKAWNGSIRKRRAKHPSPLVGKLFDDTGDRLTPSHATKQGVRYRYYISNRLMKQPKKLAGDVWRLPAPELEKTISNAVADHLRTATMAGLVDRPRLQSSLPSRRGWMNNSTRRPTIKLLSSCSSLSRGPTLRRAR